MQEHGRRVVGAVLLVSARLLWDSLVHDSGEMVRRWFVCCSRRVSRRWSMTRIVWRTSWSDIGAVVISIALFRVHGGVKDWSEKEERWRMGEKVVKGGARSNRPHDCPRDWMCDGAARDLSRDVEQVQERESHHL